MRYNLCITFILDHHFALKGESGIEVHFDDNKNVPITVVFQICDRKTREQPFWFFDNNGRVTM